MSSSSHTPLDAKRLRLLEWATTIPSERAKAELPETQADMAAELGIAPRTLRTWLREEEFVAAQKKRVYEVSGGPERTQAILDALYEQATEGKSPQAAKLWLEATGAITPKGKPEEQLTKSDLKSMTKEALEEMAAKFAHDELAARREDKAVSGAR